MYLFARVTGVGTAAKGSGNAPIRVYPVQDDMILKMQDVVGKDVRVMSQEDVHKDAISELQFWANPKVFTIGSLVWGHVKVTGEQKLQSYDPGDPTHQTLVPRILTTEDGAPVEDKDGNEIVCRRLTVALQPGAKYIRALPAEEAAQEVAELPFQMVA